MRAKPLGELDVLRRYAAEARRRRRCLISCASLSVAPLTAPRPVTANCDAYVPEKPACEFQYESWPGAHVDVVGRDAEDVGDDLRGRRLVPLPLRHRAERDDDLAEDVELHRRDLVVARELQLGVEQLRLAEVVRARVERRADAEAEQLPARLGVAPPLLERRRSRSARARCRGSARSRRSRRRSRSASRTASRRRARSCACAPRPGRARARCATMSMIRSVSQRCCMRE